VTVHHEETKGHEDTKIGLYKTRERRYFVIFVDLRVFVKERHS